MENSIELISLCQIPTFDGVSCLCDPLGGCPLSDYKTHTRGKLSACQIVNRGNSDITSVMMVTPSLREYWEQSENSLRII